MHKKSLKNTSGVHASSHKPTKNETRKNNVYIKMLLMEGGSL